MIFFEFRKKGTVLLPRILFAFLLLFSGCGKKQATKVEEVVFVESPKKGTIVLDAGHGGKDSGARSQGLQEKKVAHTTTLYVKEKLEGFGYTVVLTRPTDEFLTLSRRASISKGYPGSLFVSIHYNASHNKEASGIEIYYYGKKSDWRTHASKRLAIAVLEGLIAETSAKSRGVRHGNFHVIRENEVPAILIEGGFLTNIEENTLLRDRDYLEKIATGIALGIHNYCSL